MNFVPVALLSAEHMNKQHDSCGFVNYPDRLLCPQGERLDHVYLQLIKLHGFDENLKFSLSLNLKKVNSSTQ